MPETGNAACMRCGRQRNADAPAGELLCWAAEWVGEKVNWLCPDCARSHVRDIESKLPLEYW